MLHDYRKHFAHRACIKQDNGAHFENNRGEVALGSCAHLKNKAQIDSESVARDSNCFEA